MPTRRAFFLSALVAATATTAAAQASTEHFELLCRSVEPGGPNLAFDVLIYENGAEISTLGASPQNPMKLGVYVNALTWNDAGLQYVADRFNGILVVKPTNQRFTCEKRGGRRF